LEVLRRLGFKVEPRRRPENQSTAAFLGELGQELEQGTAAFLLPCLYGGEHWVCVGAWDGTRPWVVDSYTDDPPHIHFWPYPAQEFYDAACEDDGSLWINVVRPGHWAGQYCAWLPARRALMRMPVQDDLASMEAAVALAAHHYLDDAEYSYHESGLYLYLAGGVEISVQVQNPGADAVLVCAEGVGEDRVLVVRRALGMLTQQPPPGQTPPELVVRVGLLGAAELR